MQSPKESGESASTIDLITGEVVLGVVKSNAGMYGKSANTRPPVRKRVSNALLEDLKEFMKDRDVVEENEYIFVNWNGGFLDRPSDQSAVSRVVSDGLGLNSNLYRKYVASAQPIPAGSSVAEVEKAVEAAASELDHSVHVHRQHYVRPARPEWIQRRYRDREEIDPDRYNLRSRSPSPPRQRTVTGFRIVAPVPPSGSFGDGF